MSRVRDRSGDDVLDDLLEACGHGDMAAFATLYDETAPLVYGLVRTVLVDEKQAEQVTLQTYLHAWHAAPSYDRAYASAAGRLLAAASWRLLNYGRSGFDGA